MGTSLDRMILSAVRCTICGAPYGQCDCWTKHHCGWSFRKGTSCRNPACGGSGELEAVAGATAPDGEGG